MVDELQTTAALTPRSDPDAHPSDRLDKLRQVHRAMDNNNSGYIEAAELMLLGQARRKLGQATGEWTAEANNALLKELDVTGDGHVETTEFVEYFNKALPQDSAEFNTVVGQFMEVAAYCTTSAEEAPKQAEPRKRAETIAHPGAATVRVCLHACSLCQSCHTPVLYVLRRCCNHR